jgi:hypothetical protein
MKLHQVEELLREAVEATERFFEAIEQLPPTEALANYAKLKQGADALGARLKLLNKLQQFQQYTVMPRIMIGNNIRTFTDDALGLRFGLSSRYSAKILDKLRAFEWLRSQGQGGLITETVNAQTLGAFAGNWIEEQGMDLPNDIFEVKQSTYTTVTKAGKKRA